MKKETKLSWRKQPHSWTVDIILGERFAEFTFYADEFTGSGEWEISFIRRKHRGTRTISRPEEKKDIKKALQVFAALEHIFKEFIKTVEPPAFTFTASEAGKRPDQHKIKLYHKIAERIAKHGYKFEYDNIELEWKFLKKGE